LTEPHPAEDVFFSNERLDTMTLPTAHECYRHCTFSNISFKDSTLEGITFEDCVFIGCYFRRTRIDGCRFPASRFIDSTLVRPRIFDSSFSTARFDRCAPAYADMASSLPPEHNLRRELASNLANEAMAAGKGSDARQFRLEAIKAREREKLAAFKHENDYYKKYQGLDQLGAGLAYASSRANGLIWGYGERTFPLLRNVVLLALLVFPFLLYLARDGLETPDGTSVGMFGYVHLSLANLLNNEALSEVESTGEVALWISTVESFTGVIVLGLFVTLLFRTVTRR
jgi:hypothetical protein